jgi:redox-sensitive bicupin YhaK (pirin superfamily)
LIEGRAHIDGHELNKRDALAVLDAQDIDIKVTENTKILVMEVPLTW